MEAVPTKAGRNTLFLRLPYVTRTCIPSQHNLPWRFAVSCRMNRKGIDFYFLSAASQYCSGWSSLLLRIRYMLKCWDTLLWRHSDDDSTDSQSQNHIPRVLYPAVFKARSHTTTTTTTTTTKGPTDFWFLRCRHYPSIPKQ